MSIQDDIKIIEAELTHAPWSAQQIQPEQLRRILDELRRLQATEAQLDLEVTRAERCVRDLDAQNTDRNVAVIVLHVLERIKR